MTILRQQRRRHRTDDPTNRPSSWAHITFFRGSVFHIRHQPVIHSFSYPLFFSVIDLDEANVLFGRSNVYTQTRNDHDQRGTLWPLSTVMMLRDVDHLKNGRGLVVASQDTNQQLSLQERIGHFIYERTNGKLDLRSSLRDVHRGVDATRKVRLVTHLMYYGYCFNPVSFYYVTQTTTPHSSMTIEAIVVEVSNTPWNEMSIYVLHPDSVDVTECSITPCCSDASSFSAPAYRYKFRKNFHVSPFMTMEYDYDWTFRMTEDRIHVLAKMIKRPSDTNGEVTFTAGFDITRTTPTTTKYTPIQWAMVISRFPIYCWIIQIWIHYEAIQLLWKGVQFIPHPEGSETVASKAIAAVMAPVFAMKEGIEKRWNRKRD